MASRSELPRGIRRRCEKYFVDVTHKGQRKTSTCDTLDEALVKKIELTDALHTGKDVARRRANAKTWTLQQALDKTVRMPAPEGWRGASYALTAERNVTSAAQHMGPTIRLDAISRDRIDAWCNSLEAEGNSDSTINRKLSSLSKVLRIAVSYGGLDVMPQMPKLRREPVGRIRQISPEEETALLQRLTHLGKPALADFVAVLIDTGMRRGELLNVRPTDVSTETNVVLIHGTDDRGTKNGKYRSVPMTKRVRAILSERRRGRTCFDDVSSSDMRHTWDRAKAGMGLADDKDFTLHVCRHTCASRLVQKGVSLAVVKDWLGHSSIQTTMRYAHLYPTDLMNAVKALEVD